MNTVRTILIVGMLLALFLGVAGGFLSLHYAGTFLLGFLSGFVMIGLITFFVMAARLENEHYKK